jgi:hypothetical protein
MTEINRIHNYYSYIIQKDVDKHTENESSWLRRYLEYVKLNLDANEKLKPLLEIPEEVKLKLSKLEDYIKSYKSEVESDTTYEKNSVIENYNIHNTHYNSYGYHYYHQPKRRVRHIIRKLIYGSNDSLGSTGYIWEEIQLGLDDRLSVYK